MADARYVVVLILLTTTGKYCINLIPQEWIEGDQGELQCVNEFAVTIKQNNIQKTYCETGNAAHCQPTVPYSNVTVVDNTVTFTIANVSKQRDDGQWKCNTQPIPIDVKVPVPDADITNKNNLIFTDNNTTTITCQTGVSHPHASIAWSIGGNKHPIGTTTNNTDGTTTSILQYTAHTTDHTETLQCTATNGYVTNKTDSMVLNIRCAPKEGSVDCRPMGTNVQLVASVTAYPVPSFTWCYTNTTTGSPITICNDSLQLDVNTSTNKFKSTLNIPIPQNLDDKSYTAYCNVTNDVGSIELDVPEASLTCKDKGIKLQSNGLLSNGLLVAMCVLLVSFQRYVN